MKKGERVGKRIRREVWKEVWKEVVDKVWMKVVDTEKALSLMRLLNKIWTDIR